MAIIENPLWSTVTAIRIILIVLILYKGIRCFRNRYECQKQAKQINFILLGYIALDFISLIVFVVFIGYLKQNYTIHGVAETEIQTETVLAIVSLFWMIVLGSISMIIYAFKKYRASVIFTFIYLIFGLFVHLIWLYLFIGTRSSYFHMVRQQREAQRLQQQQLLRTNIPTQKQMK